ncbi:thrombospondin type 3 repeat-containing protein, partial [Candidatus Parcubacteria bacterium]|nr:thrombospondin type 3 repeat-containing protein [Candidatus Parcubacteria bacterium]
ANSVDFNIDLEIETKTDKMSQPLTAHADIDGQFDSDKNGSLDLYVWSNNQLDEFNQYNGSAIITENKIYFSEAEGDWYFTNNNISADDLSVEEISQTASKLSDLMQEMLDQGLIKYNPEAVDFINGKLALRYAYEFDIDNFEANLASEGNLSVDSLARIHDVLNNVTISGNLWVDTAKMLPVMFTVNVASNQSQTSYTTIKLSVLFNSFNEPVKVTVPKTAIDFESYDDSKTEDFIMSSLQSVNTSIDADADGLTDQDEITIWNTDPYISDTDGDGYKDGTEVVNGYNPNGKGKLDSDGDGLSDYNEMTIHWTNRFDADSDNDGYNDGLEVANGYDPNGPGRW